MIRVLAAFLIILAPAHSELIPSQELLAGKYREIFENPEHPRNGEWAFARFFITPDREAYRAALQAHETGDLLGTYVLMRCHRVGAGVRRDMNIVWEANATLREALETVETPTSLDSYILASLSQADRTGNIDVSTFEPSSDAYQVAGKRSHQHLADAAAGGLAQAITEQGISKQGSDPKAALALYLRAAESGLASAMKDCGYLYAVSDGTEKNPAEAYRWTRLAAEGGDIYAHLNMSAFHQKLSLPGSTDQEARKFIDSAGEHGHPLGKIEKAIALWRGNHGYTEDKKGSLALIQEAASSGHGFTLKQIAYFFTKSDYGVPKDLRKAITFGKAAWVQGEKSAASVLERAYSQLENPTAKEKAAAGYWKTHALGGGLAHALGTDDNYPEILAELNLIDPFSLTVE